MTIRAPSRPLYAFTPYAIHPHRSTPQNERTYSSTTNTQNLCLACVMTACSAKIPTLSIPVSRFAAPEGCAYVWLVVRHVLCAPTDPSEKDTCELFLYFSTKPFGTANLDPSVFSTCAFGRFRGASGWYGASFFSPPEVSPIVRTFLFATPLVVVPSKRVRLPYALGALYPVGFTVCAIATSSPPTRTRRVPVPRGLRTPRDGDERGNETTRRDAAGGGGGAEPRTGGGHATGEGSWRDAVGQGRARERFRLGLSGEGGHHVPGTARTHRPDAAVVSVVVVAVRGFVLRTRFRDRGWRAESRGDDERARVAHAPRRVLIVAVTLSHVELPSACRAGTTGRTKGRGESFQERTTSRRFQKWKSPDPEIKLRASGVSRRRLLTRSLTPSDDFPTRGVDALVGDAVGAVVLCA